MRKFFDPECSAEAYAQQGKDYDFPQLERCTNVKCKNQKVHKHGFYERNCCDGFVWYRIRITIKSE